MAEDPARKKLVKEVKNQQRKEALVAAQAAAQAVNISGRNQSTDRN